MIKTGSSLNVTPGSGRDDETLITTPTEQLQENLPQPTGIFDDVQSTLEEIQGAAPAASDTPYIPGVMEQQTMTTEEGEVIGVNPEEQMQQQEDVIESHRIRSLREQAQNPNVGELDISPWESDEALFDSVGVDAGSTARAARITQKVNTGKDIHQETYKQMQSSVDISPGSVLGKLALAVGGATYDPVTSGYKVNNDFIRTLTLHAEDFFGNKVLGSKPKKVDENKEFVSENVQDMYDQYELMEDPSTPTGQVEISKSSTDPRKLGRDIVESYQRLKGVPQDQMMQVEDKEAAVLGDYSRELLAQVFDGIERVKVKDPVTDKADVQWVLSEAAVERLSRGHTYRNLMLPKKFIRPSKAPTTEGKIIGEVKHKTISGKRTDGFISSEEIQEAIENSGTIPNVVRPERMKILWATMLPALLSDPATVSADPLLTMFSEINNIGPSKMRQFQASKKLKKDTDPDYSPEREMNQLKHVVAQQVLGIAMERGGANYFQYFMQAFNGRLTPQASLFNPTTSKAVRFVTSNATPTEIKPGTRMMKVAMQAYALVIGGKVGDANLDGMIPSEREKYMIQQQPKLERWGDILTEVMDNTMTDGEAEAIAKAIADGVPMNDPRFPKVKPMALDPQAHAELIAAIQKKGEDGPAFIDGLIDFAKFSKAMRNGKTHYSYLNPTIDGKTNGPASNGIQMGSMEMALRTGVIRSDASLFAVEDDKDIRDVLQEKMDHRLKNEEFTGHFKHPEEVDMVRELGLAVSKHRELNKLITMTFGYGKEMNSFLDDIKNTMEFLATPDELHTPDKKAQQERLSALVEYFRNNTGDDRISYDQVAKMIMEKYEPSVREVMTADGIEARHLLWGGAFFAGLADMPAIMYGPTGLKIGLAGVTRDLEADRQQVSYRLNNKYVDVVDKKTGELKRKNVGKSVTAEMFESKNTAAAPRVRTKINPQTGKIEESVDYGGKAHGGIIPAPIQALDAATVVRTLSGNSWKKIKYATNNRPYIHQVYDAFKFDIATYAVAAEEVNNNWLELGAQWSYLKELDKLMERSVRVIKEKLDKIPDGATVDLNDWPMIKGMLEGVKAHPVSGKPYAPNLRRKLMSMGPSTNRQEWAMAKHDAMFRIASKNNNPYNINTMTKAQLKSFLSVILDSEGSDGLRQRTKGLYRKTEKQKRELIKYIKDNGIRVYQYYAH
jgi:hypothetical protein